MSSRKRWSLNSSFRSLSVFIFLFLIQYRMLAFSLFSWSSAFVIEFFDGVVESRTQGFFFFVRRSLFAFIYAHCMSVLAERFAKLGTEHFPYSFHVAGRDLAVISQLFQGKDYCSLEVFSNTMYALGLNPLGLFPKPLQIFLQL